MNAFLRKEARLLLPFWGIAMVLAILPSFAVPAERYIDGVREIIFWTFGFGMILLGMAPFGHEFSLGTFSFLLAQPSQRRRIWRAKTLLVAIAAVLVFAAFTVSVYVRVHAEFLEYRETDLTRYLAQLVATHQITPAQAAAMRVNFDQFWNAFGIGVLLVAVGISGGFWSTLLFRQTGAALWFAILIPGLLIVVVEGISHLFLGGEPRNFIWAIVLVLYSGAGFVWARRLFANAQDSQWLGETVAFFSLSSPQVQAEDATVPRHKGALRALVRKELQSHQISFIIGFGILVLHLCTLVIRGVSNLPRNSEFRLALEAVPFLWLLIPWLMGSVAIAEERKLGTMESQLCLPVNRRLQFAVKFVVVLLLGILLGGVVPYLIESLGSLAGVFSEIVRSTRLPGGPTYFATLLELLIGSALIAFVSLFASSLTRNTLHALGAAIVFGVCWMAWAGAVMAQFEGYALWRGPLIYFISVPVAVIATVALSFSNYKTLHAGSRVWLRTFAVLFVALFCSGMAAAVLYQRPWELTQSLEPQHGARQLTGPLRPVLRNAANRLFAFLPDGRIWAATDYQSKIVGQERSWNERQQQVFTTDVEVSAPTSGMFVEGNWVEMAAIGNVADVIALRSDGSLWDLFPRDPSTNDFVEPVTNRWSVLFHKWMSMPPNPKRLGADNDWKTIAFGGSAFYGIKTNGTLWTWELNFGRGYQIHVADPVQMGTNSDWSRFITERSGILMMKTDGDLWGWRDVRGKAEFVRTGWNGSDWQSVSGGSFDDLVVHQDGTLWASSWSVPRYVFGTRIPAEPYGKQFRVGKDSDWLQLSGYSPDLFALKKDGRLIKNSTELFSSALGRRSQYSDWIAINAEMVSWDQMIVLAADGTLCSWVDNRNWGGANVLFGPTRRPAWTLNILTTSKN